MSSTITSPSSSDSEEEYSTEDNTGADPDALRAAISGLIEGGVLETSESEQVLALIRRGRHQRASLLLSTLIHQKYSQNNKQNAAACPCG